MRGCKLAADNWKECPACLVMNESSTCSPPSEREGSPPPSLQIITTMQQDAVVVELQQSEMSATGGESAFKDSC